MIRDITQRVINVAIIGGGASGLLAAIHILKAEKSPLSLSIYEPADELGAGLAYGTMAREHILNVPAEKMSCDENDPLSFVNWIKDNRPAVFNDKNYPFVSRQFFKEYLQSEFKKEKKHKTVRWIKQKVVRIAQEPNNCWQVNTHNTQILYDICVIATGYRSTPRLPTAISAHSKNVVVNPYHFDIDSSQLQEVAIIGTGLTAVDIWRSLREKNYFGKVHFLSRRALFPISFSIKKEVIAPIEINTHQSPLNLLRKLKALKKSENCETASLAHWLRPFISTFWKSWSDREKKQFLTHLRPYWDSIRHRLPDKVYDELQVELKEKNSFVYKARDICLSEEHNRSRIQFAGPTSLLVDKVFIATGALTELEPFAYDATVLLKCPFGLGFNTQKQNLYLVGPVTRTLYWEISAVPEIRVQAQQVAESIATSF